MVKFKDLSRPLGVFQVLFKANLIFKAFQDSHVYSSTFQACANPDRAPYVGVGTPDPLKTAYSIKCLWYTSVLHRFYCNLNNVTSKFQFCHQTL